MEQKLDITKLSKVDKILFLELMKGFVGPKKNLYKGYCGLCYAFMKVADLFTGGSYCVNVARSLRHLGLIRPRTVFSFWYTLDKEGTAIRLALIDKAIEKLKNQ